MAIEGLTIHVLYCINLTLSNGGIKTFMLQPRANNEGFDGLYYTSDYCTSEDGFWIRRSDREIFFDYYHERWKSRLDFIQGKHDTDSSEETLNGWTTQYFSGASNISVSINGKPLLKYNKVGLSDGDKVQIKYTGMSKPLNLVYGKCSQMNERVPAEGVTDMTTISTVSHSASTTHKLNWTGTTTNLPLEKELISNQRHIEELAELVKVLNDEMETVKVEVKQLRSKSFHKNGTGYETGKTHSSTPSQAEMETLKMEMETLRKGQSIQETSPTSWLVVFTILSVLGISLLLTFIIYKIKIQKQKIDTLSMEVTRYRSEI